MTRYYIQKVESESNSYHVYNKQRKNTKGESFLIKSFLTLEEANSTLDALNNKKPNLIFK